MVWRDLRFLSAIQKNNNQVYDEVYALPDFKKILTDKHKIVVDS